MPNPEPAAPNGRRRTLSAVLGAAIALVLLVWALRGVHPQEVLTHLRNAHAVPLVAAVVLATLTYPIRLIRWRLLLRDTGGGPLPAAPLWHAVAIGFMANNMLPFRAGELVRVLAATRLTGARFSSTLSSVAVERIFDGLAVVLLLSFALLASELPPGVAVGGVPVRHAAQVAGAMGVAALMAAVLVVAFPLGAERLVRRVLPAGGLTERLVNLIEGLRHGLSVLRSPWLLAGVVFWSLVLWMTNALAFYVGFTAFDIPVDYPGALLVQGVLVFGITVQLTPGFLGQFEAVIVAGLALFGVANDLASSFAIAFHATTFVPIILLGAWSLARTPVALSDLRAPQQP
ncbi:MAG TPA: lysylphosphatidylglycerol synthase transmembrane domain-containing protein [Gemmatimonadales bacterium]|nr:lysylphosphatidylglycerol synthase transmembrane domain-containing protein [Gemmatimonadales bacterium]